MNASRRESKNVKLFFPDPWVYSEKAYPKNLNKILEPIKRTIKNRGNDSILSKIIYRFSIIYEINKYIGVLKITNFIFKTLIDYFRYKKSSVFL